MIKLAESLFNQRTMGLKKAIELMHSNLQGKPAFIVETGTTRGEIGGGQASDGWATPIFGNYCKNYGGQLWTIDIDAQAIEECKAITKDYAEHIKYCVGPSTEILSTIEEKVDLLYLDSANDPQIALAELKAIENNLCNESIILVDDTSIRTKRNGGICKGVLVYKYLLEHGWNLSYDDGAQIIITKDHSVSRSFLEKCWHQLKCHLIYRRVLRKRAF